MLWKIIPRPAPLVDKYRCTHLTLAAREKKIGLKGTKNEKRDCNVLQLQYHSLPAQLLQMKKISFELVFTKLGFEVLILYYRKKKKNHHLATELQISFFLRTEKTRQPRSQTLPNLLLKARQLTVPRTGPHLYRYQTWHGGNTLTGVCRESLGVLVAKHQQELRSGAQQILGSNSGIPNQKWPLPGEVFGSCSLGYT